MGPSVPSLPTLKTAAFLIPRISSAAGEIRGIKNVAIFSVGSDGTDGPTDAAGGYVDGDTLDALAEQGIDYTAALNDNDSYHALKAIGGLIMTGPTGTNVNDVSVVLMEE